MEATVKNMTNKELIKHAHFTNVFTDGHKMNDIANELCERLEVIEGSYNELIGKIREVVDEFDEGEEALKKLTY